MVGLTLLRLLVDGDGSSGRGKLPPSPPFPVPPQTWRMAAGSGLLAHGADSSVPSRIAATPPRPRSTAASLPPHLFFYSFSTTASSSNWRSTLPPAARSPQHRDPPQQRGLSDSMSLFLLGFGTNVTQFLDQEEGGKNLQTFKDASPSWTTAPHKTQLKVQAWSSFVFHCRHASFYPSRAPLWDSTAVSGAGVTHYYLLHRPRFVPMALGPAPLITINITVDCF